MSTRHFRSMGRNTFQSALPNASHAANSRPPPQRRMYQPARSAECAGVPCLRCCSWEAFGCLMATPAGVMASMIIHHSGWQVVIERLLPITLGNLRRLRPPPLLRLGHPLAMARQAQRRPATAVRARLLTTHDTSTPLCVSCTCAGYGSGYGSWLRYGCRITLPPLGGRA